MKNRINAQTTVKPLRDLIKTGGKASVKEDSLWQFGKLVIEARKWLQRFFVFPLHGLFVRIKVKNKQNLADIKPPVIFYFNHLGPYDALCIPRVLPSVIRKKIALLADTLDWHRYFGSIGFLVQLLGGLAIAHKRKVFRSGLENAGELVADGFSLLIAPEGRFSKTGKLGEFKSGIGMLAVELRMPVVPIKISPSYQEIFQPTPFGRKRNYIPNKRGKIAVSIGKPLSFPKDTPYIQAARIMREEMERLKV